MTLEAIGFGLTVAAFAKALPEILKCAQDILDSEQNSYELKKQKRKFDRYVSKVEAELKHLLRSRPRPVPRDLLRASLALVKYCKGRIVKAEKFYKRFEADPLTFRFIIHMARVFGKDKIRLLKRRLGEGEDWLRIALTAVALNVELARENIETRREYRQQAEQLRYHLEKAQRYRKEFPGRMKHMNKAKVDYRCIASHAHAIANHPIFEGSELSSSSITISTSPSDNEHIDQGTRLRHPMSKNIYQPAENPIYQGPGGYPLSQNPEASGAPLETWVSAHGQPVWSDNPYYDPLTGMSRHISTTWVASPRYLRIPQTVQTRSPGGPPAGAPQSRQRQHTRVVDANPGHSFQDGMHRTSHSVRVYQVPPATVQSRGSDHASNTASRSTHARSQSSRAPLQQHEAPLRRRRASVSPPRSSHARTGSNMPNVVDTSQEDGPQRTHTLLNGGHDTTTYQRATATTSPPSHHPRSDDSPDHVPIPICENLPNSRDPPYIHVETRHSSRSRSSSLAGSSPSTIFSRATGRTPSSVITSPAMSFSNHSTRSARDSGYSTGGSSVCDQGMDKEQQKPMPGDSRYPPNSHETRRGGYDLSQERRRLRRERCR